MRPPSRHALLVKLSAMLLTIAAPSVLHAEPDSIETDGLQPAKVHEASPSTESAPIEDAHAHEDLHSHAAPTAVAIAPEDGWASDAPLRQGMQAILDALVAAVRDGREGKVLASELRSQVRYLLANCKLEPQADAALHGILAELLESAQRLEAGVSASEEHDALHAALAAYGQQFQHPGWPLD